MGKLQISNCVLNHLVTLLRPGVNNVPRTITVDQHPKKSVSDQKNIQDKCANSYKQFRYA